MFDRHQARVLSEPLKPPPAVGAGLGRLAGAPAVARSFGGRHQVGRPARALLSTRARATRVCAQAFRLSCREPELRRVSDFILDAATSGASCGSSDCWTPTEPWPGTRPFTGSRMARRSTLHLHRLQPLNPAEAVCHLSFYRLARTQLGRSTAADRVRMGGGRGHLAGHAATAPTPTRKLHPEPADGPRRGAEPICGPCSVDHSPRRPLAGLPSGCRSRHRRIQRQFMVGASCPSRRPGFATPPVSIRITSRTDFPPDAPVGILGSIDSRGRMSRSRPLTRRDRPGYHDSPLCHGGRRAMLQAHQRPARHFAEVLSMTAGVFRFSRRILPAGQYTCPRTEMGARASTRRASPADRVQQPTWSSSRLPCAR